MISEIKTIKIILKDKKQNLKLNFNLKKTLIQAIVSNNYKINSKILILEINLLTFLIVIMIMMNFLKLQEKKMLIKKFWKLK